MMKEKDLFCGMLVDPDTAPASHEYKGNVYYFCDAACKQMFILDPEKYIQLEAGKPT